MLRTFKCQEKPPGAYKMQEKDLAWGAYSADQLAGGLGSDPDVGLSDLRLRLLGFNCLSLPAR